MGMVIRGGCSLRGGAVIYVAIAAARAAARCGNGTAVIMATRTACSTECLPPKEEVAGIGAAGG